MYRVMKSNKGSVSYSLLVFLCLIAAGCDLAHYRLEGNIYYQIDKVSTPVSNADVALECAKLEDKKTKTTSDGHFVIEGNGFLDKDVCSINVAHPEFKMKVVKILPENLKGERNLVPKYEIQIQLDK